MQDALKAVWSIPHVSVAFFASLKYNFIAYRSSKVSSSPDCIFEIHQQWQLGFSRVCSNSCCSCSFEPEILKIGQSSHKMYSNNIVNFQESTTILNACTKNSLKAPRIFQQFFLCLKKAIRALLFPNFWEKQDFFSHRSYSWWGLKKQIDRNYVFTKKVSKFQKEVCLWLLSKWWSMKQIRLPFKQSVLKNLIRIVSTEETACQPPPLNADH